MSEEEIYQEHILDHYEDPFHKGSCAGATHVHEDDNPLCGDVVRMEAKIGDDGTIDELFFNGDGCCISQAAASMIVERMQGKTVDEVRAFTAEDMLELIQAKLTPNRQKCGLLSWRVLQGAVYGRVGSAADPIETKSGEERTSEDERN